MSSTRASGFFMREDYAPAPKQTVVRVCGFDRKEIYPFIQLYRACSSSRKPA